MKNTSGPEVSPGTFQSQPLSVPALVEAVYNRWFAGKEAENNNNEIHCFNHIKI